MLDAMKIRVGAPRLNFYVNVRVRSFDGRWLAVADIGGDPEIGLGGTGREALAASLSSLGAAATDALLTDPQVIGLSARVGRRSYHA